MSVGPGTQVRMLPLRGVASDRMRACVDAVGVVRRVDPRQPGKVEAWFGGTALYEADVFWLGEGEWEAVQGAPVLHVGQPIDREGTSVADFVAVVQRRIDQLAEEDASLVAQLLQITERRTDVAQERRALAASLAAYRRVRDAGGPKALPPPRGEASSTHQWLVRWAERHHGEIDRSAAVRAAVHEGVSVNSIAWALANHPEFERTKRGVYRLREGSAA